LQTGRTRRWQTWAGVAVVVVVEELKQRAVDEPKERVEPVDNDAPRRYRLPVRRHVDVHLSMSRDRKQFTMTSCLVSSRAAAFLPAARQISPRISSRAILVKCFASLTGCLMTVRNQIRPFNHDASTADLREVFIVNRDDESCQSNHARDKPLLSD